MVTCKLGDKEYHVDYIKGRALREISEASKMYAKVCALAAKVEAGEELTEEDQKLNIQQALDVMVRWFCVLFNNQFTPAEFYDNYPVDSMMHDVGFAILMVNAQTTQTLTEFPMTPTARKGKTRT